MVRIREAHIFDITHMHRSAEAAERDAGGARADVHVLEAHAAAAGRRLGVHHVLASAVPRGRRVLAASHLVPARYNHTGISFSYTRTY